MIDTKKIGNFSAIEVIIKGERLLIETKFIKEILIPEEQIIPVPFSRKSIIGIIDVRGEIHSIISLRKILFKETQRNLIENKPILLIDLEGLKIGILVDSVFDVQDFSNSIFEKKDIIHKTQIDPKFIKQIGFSNSDSVILLELNSIIQTFFTELEEESTTSLKSDTKSNSSKKTSLIKDSTENQKKINRDKNLLSIDKLKLTTVQKDALYELGNIGAGNAANALFKMVNMKVEVNIPNVEIVDINQYFNALFNNTEKIFISRSQINDKIQATLLLILRLPDLLKLLSIIENKKDIESKNISKLQDLSISSKKIATKLANTLISQYIETMGNLLGYKLNIKSPIISLDIKKEILDNLKEEVEYIQKLALIIDTNLINNDIKNSGLFLLIPNVKTLPILLDMLFESK